MTTSLYDHPSLRDLSDAPQHVRERVARIAVAAGPDLARQGEAWAYLASAGTDVATCYWATRIAGAVALALG